jgi:DNA replication protein DnaC
MKRIETLTELEKKMTDLRRYMEALTKPVRGCNLVIAAGDPGLGKTYMAKEILEKHKKTEEKYCISLLEIKF